MLYAAYIPFILNLASSLRNSLLYSLHAHAPILYPHIPSPYISSVPHSGSFYPYPPLLSPYIIHVFMHYDKWHINCGMTLQLELRISLTSLVVQGFCHQHWTGRLDFDPLSRTTGHPPTPTDLGQVESPPYVPADWPHRRHLHRNTFFWRFGLSFIPGLRTSWCHLSHGIRPCI